MLFFFFLLAFNSFGTEISDKVEVLEGVMSELTRNSLSTSNEIYKIRRELENIKVLGKRDVINIIDNRNILNLGIRASGGVTGDILFSKRDSNSESYSSYIPSFHLGTPSGVAAISARVHLKDFVSFTEIALGSQRILSAFNRFSFSKANLSLFTGDTATFRGSTDRLNIFNPNNSLRLRSFQAGISAEFNRAFGIYSSDLSLFLATVGNNELFEGNMRKIYRTLFTLTFNNKFKINRNYWFDLNINFYDLLSGSNRNNLIIEQASSRGIASVSTKFNIDNNHFNESYLLFEYATNMSTTSRISGFSESVNVLPIINLNKNSALLLETNLLYQNSLRINLGLVEYGGSFDKSIQDSNGNFVSLRRNTAQSTTFDILSAAHFRRDESIAFAAIRIFEDRSFSPYLFYAHSHLINYLDTFGTGFYLRKGIFNSTADFNINQERINIEARFSILNTHLETLIFIQDYRYSDFSLTIFDMARTDILIKEDHNVHIALGSIFKVDDNLDAIYNINSEYTNLGAFGIFGKYDIFTVGFDFQKRGTEDFSSGYLLHVYAEETIKMSMSVDLYLGAIVGFDSDGFLFGINALAKYSMLNNIDLRVGIESMTPNINPAFDLDRGLTKNTILDETRIFARFNLLF